MRLFRHFSLLWPLLLASMFSPNASFAQQADSHILQSIEFEGLSKNKRLFLDRIIYSEVGAPLDAVQVQTDLKYLRQLSGIATADFRIDSTEQGLTLVFLVVEAESIFPIVNFGGIRNNFWFQLGLTEANLAGMGHQLTVYYQNIDSRHNGNLYYRIPFIAGSPWGVTLNLRRFASVEPIYFDEAPVLYDYNNNSAGASVFYQLKSNHFVELGGTFFTEDFAKNERHEGAVTPGPNQISEPKLLFKAIHHINEIDHHYFYQDGFSNQFNVESVYNINPDFWFHLIFNDTRYLKRIGRWGNLGFRLRLGLSSNSNNPFAPFVLDSYVNIRGSGNRIDRGTAAVVLNAEYRQTVYEGKLFAGQLVAFSDSGTWRNPGGSLEDLADSDNFRHFVGGGIRLIYKKAFNAMLRIDYGVDVWDVRQRGIVLGFGQYF